MALDASIKTVKGMRITTPPTTDQKEMVVALVKKIATQYGYHLWELPILEHRSVFQKSLGVESNIIGKEMYQFEDINGDQLCLRPEGTAGVIRAGVERGLFFRAHKRMCYVGPMFRRENPQKGRFRQFTQFGLEYVGSSSPYSELELIALTHDLICQLGLANSISLEINSIGTAPQRQAYGSILQAWVHTALQSSTLTLDPQTKKTLERNPIRIFDSKNSEVQALLADAPSIEAYLTPEQKDSYQHLTDTLRTRGISFQHNPQLVRGLDYYNDFVFEWVLKGSGRSQSTFIAGGRYDTLIELLGGEPQPAVGCAIGVDRMVDFFDLPVQTPAPSLYLIALDQPSLSCLATQAALLRTQFPEIRVVLDTSCQQLKSQFNRSQSYAPCFFLIMGEKERAENKIVVKSTPNQSQSVLLPDLVEHIRSLL